MVRRVTSGLLFPWILFAAGSYTGGRVCAGCHAEIAAGWSATPMARSFSKAKSPINGTYRHDLSGERFTWISQIGKTQLRREQDGFGGSSVNILEKKVEYQFGSGNHARSYFGLDSAGNMVELPISWYADRTGDPDRGHWAMSPGYNSARHSGFSRRITDQCLFCHTAYPQAGALPEPMDCERCHGPGSQHVELSRQGKTGGIVNPARLAPDRSMEVCLQCHLETTNLSLPGSILRYGRDVFSYVPGEPLGNYAQYFDHAPGTGHEDKLEFASAPYRLFQSQCFLKSAGKLTCTTCHRPHGGAPGRNSYADACRSCHASAIDSMVAARRHPGDGDCVACHMGRRRPSDAVEVVIADHKISRTSSKAVPSVTVEQNSASMPPYRGKVVQYYPPQADELYLAVAQVRNQANLVGGLPDLEAAITRLQPREPGPFIDLADAYRHAGNLQKAEAAYRRAVELGGDWRPVHGLGLTLSAQGRLKPGEDALRTAKELASSEPIVYESLAGNLTAQGRIQDAVGVLREGIRKMPDSPDLHNNLGTSLVRLGDSASAEAELREAVRLRPELPNIRVNLAEVLSRNGKWPEARFEFEWALRLDPTSASVLSSYGTALFTHGELPAAKSRFEAALRIDPTLSNTHNNLGTVLKKLGDRAGARSEFEEAIRLQPEFAVARYNFALEMVATDAVAAESQLREALRLAPNYYAAHFELANILLARGATGEAGQHLQYASKTPDPALGNAVRRTLATIK